MKRAMLSLFIGGLVLATTPFHAAAVTVGVDPSAPWLGFMNVFELPVNGSGYAFGSVWGTADLKAVFTGPTLKIEANTIPTMDNFWYVNGVGGPGAAGNKNMEANFYVEDTALTGQNVTFTGNVLSNSLVDPYTSVAFIKDFAPDYSSHNIVTAALTPGVFSINMATDPTPGRHVQYGFLTLGPNVWATDVESKGFVTVTAVGSGGVTGDYSNNGAIDAADYSAWRTAFGTTTLPNLSPTKVGTVVDASDYTVWRDLLPASAVVASGAAVPEPATWTLGILVVGIWAARVMAAGSSPSQA